MRRTLCFLLPLATLLLFAAAQKFFVRYSWYHALGTCHEEKALLESFREIIDQVTLPQPKIAMLLREHLAEYKTGCHGEPYSKLQAGLPGEKE